MDDKEIFSFSAPNTCILVVKCKISSISLTTVSPLLPWLITVSNRFKASDISPCKVFSSIPILESRLGRASMKLMVSDFILSPLIEAD